MASSISALTSSFFSLSLPSQISQKPSIQSLSFRHVKPLSIKLPTLIVSASADLNDATTADLNDATTAELTDATTEELTDATTDELTDASGEEPEDLVALVKSRLPGGFAAQTIIGTGRRKCAIARVVLQEGTGRVIINYREARDYLQGNPLWLEYVKNPLMVFGYEKSYDVFVKAHGGGLSGQAQAISLGVARALLKVSEIHRRPLRANGLLTRDSRIVERKKVGFKKARKRPQYSKR